MKNISVAIIKLPFYNTEIATHLNERARLVIQRTRKNERRVAVRRDVIDFGGVCS